MKTVRATELKAKLSAILGNVERGEVVEITRHGKPIAQIVPQQTNEREQRRRAIDELQTWRKTLPSTDITVDEILSARDEGRKS